MTGITKTTRHQPVKTTRRGLLYLTGAAIGLASGVSTSSGAEDAQKQKILKPGDKIDVGGKGEEIVQKTYKLGYDYEKQNGG